MHEKLNAEGAGGVICQEDYQQVEVERLVFRKERVETIRLVHVFFCHGWGNRLRALYL